eukprot:2676633-Amphidinium_carterae.1
MTSCEQTPLEPSCKPLPNCVELKPILYFVPVGEEEQTDLGTVAFFRFFRAGTAMAPPTSALPTGPLRSGSQQWHLPSLHTCDTLRPSDFASSLNVSQAHAVSERGGFTVCSALVQFAIEAPYKRPTPCKIRVESLWASQKHFLGILSEWGLPCLH